jgi:transposase
MRGFIPGLMLRSYATVSVNFLVTFDRFSLTFTYIGVRIEYLPPYSPDFQPIEEAFSKIKAFIRRHRTYYSQTTGDGILFDMYEITVIITPEDAAGYFMHAGYF